MFCEQKAKGQPVADPYRFVLKTVGATYQVARK